MLMKGFACIFNLVDLAGDTVAPGAFSKSLARQTTPVKMLYQHDTSRPIGVWHHVRETRQGLWVEGSLVPDILLTDEISRLLKHRVIDGLSIGYRVVRSAAGHGPVRRRLREVDLVEISLVTFPMQPQARVREFGTATQSGMHGNPARRMRPRAALPVRLKEKKTDGI